MVSHKPNGVSRTYKHSLRRFTNFSFLNKEKGLTLSRGCRGLSNSAASLVRTTGRGTYPRLTSQNVRTSSTYPTEHSFGSTGRPRDS